MLPYLLSSNLGIVEMAKPYKAKASSYYFKQVSEAGIWDISKFSGDKGGDSSEPEAVYTIKGSPGISGRWECTCPATWGGKNRRSQPCKHGPLLVRWIGIQSSRANQGKAVYYNSADDKFYPLPGLDLS